MVTEKKPKIPKDLKIKIGTKEEAFWSDIKLITSNAIESMEKQLKLQKAIYELAESRIKDEQS